jgi:ribonuclease P protein component
MERSYAEKNLSTEQPPPREKARIQGTDGDKERTRGAETPQGERAQTPDRTPLLGFSLPKEARLLKRAEFLRVYNEGARIEGRFMTVFILPKDQPLQRVGITATKKAIGKAHDRNRCKRLLRESFRLTRVELDNIGQRYDWVLNARRSLLHAKLDKPLAEFRGIVEKVGSADPPAKYAKGSEK